MATVALDALIYLDNVADCEETKAEFGKDLLHVLTNMAYFSSNTSIKLLESCNALSKLINP